MFEKKLFIGSMIDNLDVNAHIMLTRQNLRIQFPEINWKWDNNTHITLRFLGKIDICDQTSLNNLINIQKELHDLLNTTKKFSFQLGQLNIFSGVLWYAVEGPKEEKRLIDLAHQINIIVQKHGYELPNFGFIPHITVARFEDQYNDIIHKYITENNHTRQRNFTIDSVILLESLKFLNNKRVYQPAFQEFIWKLK